MTRQQEYEAKLLREARQIKLCRTILFILFLSLWELTASLGMINRFIFSCPSQILLCLFHMFLDKSLFLHTGVTLTETLVSFFLCTLISLITALFLWSDPLAAQVFEPFFSSLKQPSKICSGTPSPCMAWKPDAYGGNCCCFHCCFWLCHDFIYRL